MASPRKTALERLHEKLATGDRGWFFAGIADQVAERRIAQGLSQRELAELAGRTQSAVAQLRRGGRPPRIDTLLNLADALDCDLAVELFPRSSSQPRSALPATIASASACRETRR